MRKTFRNKKSSNKLKSRKQFVFIITILTGLVAILYGVVENPIVTEDRYTVVRVIDGDTIEVEHKGRTQSVRLLGVDAPEIDECFYEESSIFLRQFLANETVTLLPDPLNENTDDYGRLLRYVYLGNNLVNETLIKTGMTRHLSYFPITQNDHFAELESTAKKDNLGIWKECN